MTLFERDIYEITTKETPIHGVQLRGRIRKFCIQHLINCLAENAEETDTPNSVRFAVLHGEIKIEEIKKYIYSILSDSQIDLILTQVQNPVLSKKKVNQTDRYTL